MLKKLNKRAILTVSLVANGVLVSVVVALIFAPSSNLDVQRMYQTGLRIATSECKKEESPKQVGCDQITLSDINYDYESSRWIMAFTSDNLKNNKRWEADILLNKDGSLFMEHDNVVQCSLIEKSDCNL